MQFFTDHWVEMAVVANTTVLVFLLGSVRGTLARLAYYGRRIEKLDRVVRSARLFREHSAEPLRLVSDRSATAPAPEQPQDHYGRGREMRRLAAR